MEGDLGEFDKAVRWLRSAKKLVIFTGAGISAESGIPTFRDEGGFWRDFPPDQFATWRGLVKSAAVEPAKLIEFLLAVIEPIARAEPNPAHHAIVRLAQARSTTVITQNVDGLHQEAGSALVREIHGLFFEIANSGGSKLHRISRAELLQVVDRLKTVRRGPMKLLRLARAVRPILGLSARGIRRPNLVLFGDAMAEPQWSLAKEDVDAC